MPRFHYFALCLSLPPALGWLDIKWTEKKKYSQALNGRQSEMKHNCWANRGREEENMKGRKARREQKLELAFCWCKAFTRLSILLFINCSTSSSSCDYSLLFLDLSEIWIRIFVLSPLLSLFGCYTICRKMSIKQALKCMVAYQSKHEEVSINFQTSVRKDIWITRGFLSPQRSSKKATM